MNYTNYHATHLSGVSEPTFIKIKDRIQEWLHVDTTSKIGGEGVENQIDETAICNGEKIIKPSSIYDSYPNTQWIIVVLKIIKEKNFSLELVPNRKASTIRDLLERRVEKETIIVTNGYPSYPSAIEGFGSVNHVVNHTRGFVNRDGMYTNFIENLWSHLKQQYRSRGGVNKDRIQLFLNEFE
ncbi:hypothetical protein NGRA_2408 [Nosema granulosis]|uniref:ISXO2-like transposase domain-containing protein n=1 Tax=Nosema granulosis TaxID=83296 RepID=A0A9P6GWQ2_9MICR|nr:hypothetical protein NGRA_2408 [Nosema granulosis]